MAAVYRTEAFNLGFIDDQYVHEIAVGDFNGDRISDILFAAFYYPIHDEAIPIRIVLGTAGGGFREATSELFDGAIPGTIHPRQIAVGDFNGDGVDDIFIADHGTDNNPRGAPNLLLLSDGNGKLVDRSFTLPDNGGFTPGTGYFGGFTHSVAAGDVNGDGHLDLYVGNISGTLNTPPHLLINDGKGNFSIAENALEPGVVNLWPKFTAVKFHDMNGDGSLDLILGGHAGSPNRIYWNDGTGNFAGAFVDLPAPAMDDFDALDLAVLDLNGDSLPDLAILVGYGGSYIQLLVNQGDGTFVDETAARLPQPDFETLQWRPRLLAADFDGDLDIDLGVFGTPIRIHYNDGSGIFTTTPSFPEIIHHFQGALVDVNRDALADIVYLGGDTGGAFVTERTGAVQHGDDLANTLRGGPEDNILRGFGGNDRLFGGAGADILFGGPGSDFLDSGSAKEIRDADGVLVGGTGNLIVPGAGNNTIHVHSALDIVDNGFLFPDHPGRPQASNNIVSFADFWWDIYSAGTRLTIAESTAGTFELSAIIGGLFNSTIFGNSGDNIIFSVGGNNTVRPGAGVDWIALGDIDGYRGVDTLIIDKATPGASPSWSIVWNFAPGEDKVNLAMLGIESFDTVAAAGHADGAGNSYYLLEDGSNILFFAGLQPGDLTAGDFIL